MSHTPAIEIPSDHSCNTGPALGVVAGRTTPRYRWSLSLCVLQCAAVCCSVLQCVAVCCSVLQEGQQHVTDGANLFVCCSLLQCVAVCCRVLPWFAVATDCNVLPCIEVYYNVLQCIAVCCSALQCGAVRCSVLQTGQQRVTNDFNILRVVVCCSVL